MLNGFNGASHYVSKKYKGYLKKKSISKIQKS